MLSEEEYKSLCHLARLDSEDAGLAGLLPEFNRILEYVEQVAEIDTEEIGEYYTTLEVDNVTRPDQTAAVLTPADIRSVAPQWESGYFVVPRVIE